MYISKVCNRSGRVKSKRDTTDSDCINPTKISFDYNIKLDTI